MLNKELLSLIAIVITVAAFIPYIRSILTGEVKAHVFSWVIWGIATCVVFFAQLTEGGGVGAWPTGISGMITIFIAILAFIKRGDICITRLDWVFFVAALSSLPIWYISAEPLWAVVMLTLVDTLGFGPTFRKAYAQPYSESLLFFGLFVIRNAIAAQALAHYSVTTLLFPVAMVITCSLLMAMVLYRRWSLTRLRC